ncbi:hypothetical protein RQP53_19055 [Paucibacter sp. APW11]|uniref:Porin n=1 Tax=Roseateles aquae TaxID=3077235 RepID=A0ABU3PGZ2_9BURK|nr:hypothetical protein [Paucibacter sp. APW11]MDT9001387.1 hypothetical protein [Paucibacter sp. APW11]
MNLSRLRVSALALALASAFTVPAEAAAKESKEAERIKALEAKLEKSLAVIEQLSQRLAELEKQPKAVAVAPPQPAKTPVAQPDPVAQARIETLEQGVRDLAAATASANKGTDTGVPLHGFLDVGYVHHNKRSDGLRSGSKLGVMDIYLTPQFGSNVRSLIELAFEYGEGGSLATDAERLQIGYAFSDDFVLWAGRFHTPYGYWNTAFHHGAQIQTSITRPRFIAFEDQGGILPAHTVGAWANGRVATDLGRVSYDLYTGNGNRISSGVLDFNASGDDNSNPLLGFNVGLSLKAVPGLTLGVHGLRQTVSGENADGSVQGKARTQFLGGYGFWEGDNFELIGEYYRFSNRDLANGGSSHRSWAAYLQAGYTLADRLTGFVRFEKASLDGADPYFALQESGSSYRQTSIGLRYDLDPRSALKLQLDNNRDVANPLGTINSLRAQYAIRF